MHSLFDNRFGILSIFILFGAFNGYLLTLIFLFFRKGYGLANRILALLIFIFALRLTEVCLLVYGQIWQYPYFSGTTFPLLFLLGPLYYLYTRRLLHPDFRVTWRQTWMIIPTILEYINSWDWLTLDPVVKSQYLKSNPIWELPNVPIQVYFILGIGLAHTSTYLYFSYKIIRNHQLVFINTISNNNALNRLNWLKKLTFGACLYTGSYLVVYILLLSFNQYGTIIDRAWLLILSFLIHTIGYIAIKQPEYFAEPLPDSTPTATTTNAKYRKSALSITQAKSYLNQLTTHMEEKKPYLQDDLKAFELASALNIPLHHFSQVLTQEYGSNFFDFINSYRVEETKRLLQNPSKKHLTILALAHEAGFNNKASFNRAFKKFSGLTPSQFIKHSIKI